MRTEHYTGNAFTQCLQALFKVFFSSSYFYFTVFKSWCTATRHSGIRSLENKTMKLNDKWNTSAVQMAAGKVVKTSKDVS